MTKAELIAALRRLDVPDDTPVVFADYLDLARVDCDTCGQETIIILSDVPRE